MDQHPLGILLSRAVAGHWPAADGQTEVFPALPNGEAAVLGFTGHFVIAADVDPSWVRSRLPDDDLCAPMGPRFLHALALELRKQPGSLDLVFWASAEEGPLPVELRLTPDRSHARARRAECHRDELRVYQTPDASGVQSPIPLRSARSCTVGSRRSVPKCCTGRARPHLGRYNHLMMVAGWWPYTPG